MNRMKMIGAAAALAALAGPALAQAPCAGEDHRALDFWVGEWDVFNTADNVQYATSRIDSILGGCVISENYESPNAPGGPYSGKSYSSYDRKDGRWHQFYVDLNGAATWFTGGPEESGALTMTAQGPNGLRKMSYVPQDDGSVRQIAVVSTDGGKTWTPGYDYTYRRRAK